MSNSLNKVILIGNLGQAPEIRATNDGKEIANFSLATTESWKDKFTGDKKEKTEWHRVVCFSEGLVRVIKDYVKKGTKLYIEGQLQTRKWTDQKGHERYTTEVVLQGYNSHLILLNSSNGNTSVDRTEERPTGNGRYSLNDSKKEKEVDADIVDDEIPF